MRRISHLADLQNKSRPGAAQAVTPSGSPYTYTADRDGVLLVSGGTVSLVEYGRQGSFVVAGLISGLVPVLAGDSLRLTYVVAPTVTFLPSS